MSGSFSATSLFLDTGTSLLNTLYGIGGAAGSTTGQASLQALRLAEQNQVKEVSTTAKQPTVQQAIAAFTKGVNGATSVAQLLANPAVMRVLLTANGMADQIGYTALATKVLTSNLNDTSSLANRLTDSRWKTLANTYNFAANGLKAIQDPKVIATITSGYAQVTWQAAQDKTTPGLSKALSFKNNASTIKSADQILGNPTMREVVTVALGIPKQIAFQPLNAQETSITSRLDITKFQDPKFVETFVQRYLIANASNPDAVPATPDLITLASQGRGLFA